MPFCWFVCCGCFVVVEDELGCSRLRFFVRVLLVGLSLLWWVVARAGCWLLESAAYNIDFHGVPFRATMCRGEPGLVARGMVIVSVDCGWLLVCVHVVEQIQIQDRAFGWQKQSRDRHNIQNCMKKPVKRNTCFGVNTCSRRHSAPSVRW